MTFTERVNDLIENCNKMEVRTVELAREITEMAQQLVLMAEHMNEINQRKTELEQDRSVCPSQYLSFAEIVRTTFSAPNVVSHSFISFISRAHIEVGIYDERSIA